MPRAEAGSSKHIANQMKAKGLTRLRWYCSLCSKPCRDENGFKCHTQSESHVRNVRLAMENGSKVIDDFSKQFQQDFIQLLKTSHGTKGQNANHFYNEYIADRHHIHMNATKWKSLSEFVKHLGREGICRVEETEKGWTISWIDNSPEALRRQAAIQKRERMEKGDEEWQQKILQQQIKRAHAEASEGDSINEDHQLHRADSEKIALNFSLKPTSSKLPSPPATTEGDRSPASAESTSQQDAETSQTVTPPPDVQSKPASAPFKMSLGGSSAKKPFNVFAQKKNPLAGGKTSSSVAAPKKMTEAERIMKQEMERKRGRDDHATRPESEKKLKFGL